MSRTSKPLRSHCPVNFGLEAFGDRWALLVVRDIVFRGKRTFGDFLKAEEGWATNILAQRLIHLERQGILTKTDDRSDGRRVVYALTEKGLDLIPLVFEMVLWSAKYDKDSEAQRIVPLVNLIRDDNRGVSAEAMARVRNGEALVPLYRTVSR